MNARLELSSDEMRSIGYRIIDLIVEYQTSLAESRVCARASQSVIRAELPQSPPETGRPLDETLAELEGVVLSRRVKIDHPRFFGFVPGPSNFIGAMADALVAGVNVFQGTWFSSAGPSTLELIVIDWLKQWIGYPSKAAGLFVSGGSVANLTALAAARHAKLGTSPTRGVAYFSDQTHSSVDRALQVLGFSGDQIRKLPADGDFQIPLDMLREQVSRDRAAGLQPFCVIGNAGTTNTGAVDPLRVLVQFCKKDGLWLHLDAAYGGAAVLCQEGKRALDGIEMADSMSLDPHKWLFQPIECGCLLVREGRHLVDTFRTTPVYLQDVREDDAVHFADRGIQLTRTFRALKLWLTVHYFGLAGVRAAVARGFHLAEVAQRRLEASGQWEIVTPARMAVVTFRHRTSRRNLVEAMYQDGFALVTSTALRGEQVLRFCTINPRTTEQDVVRTVDRLEELAR